jgi:hypothetical protein
LIKTDLILFAMVMMIESEPTAPAIGVTLNTHGFLVSGVLCSRSEYMIEAEAYASGRAGLGTGTAIASLHQYVRDVEASSAASGQEVERPGDFIHLKNAHFLSSAFRLGDDGVAWRGKFSAIDAWILGVIAIQ